MKLETLDQRYELVRQMIDGAFEFEKSVADLEDDNDWAGAMTTLDNLAAIEDMICTEEILLDAFDDMQEIRTNDRDAKEAFLGILLWDGLHTFNIEVLLPRLKQAFDVLKTWGFRTERGKEFEKDYCEKLDALIKEYKSLYDI